MSEKRGQTGKLTYDFNTAAHLEAQSSRGSWCRLTAREFRSWDGPRRITEYFIDSKTKQSYSPGTLEYHGPIFVLMTNTQVEYTGDCRLVQGNRRLPAEQRDRI